MGTTFGKTIAISSNTTYRIIKKTNKPLKPTQGQSLTESAKKVKSGALKTIAIRQGNRASLIKPSTKTVRVKTGTNIAPNLGIPRAAGGGAGSATPASNGQPGLDGLLAPYKSGDGGKAGIAGAQIVGVGGTGLGTGITVQGGRGVDDISGGSGGGGAGDTGDSGYPGDGGNPGGGGGGAENNILVTPTSSPPPPPTPPPPPPLGPPGPVNLLVAPADFTDPAWTIQGATTPTFTATTITNVGGWWNAVQGLILNAGQQYTINGTVTGVSYAWGCQDGNGIQLVSGDNAPSFTFTAATSFMQVFLGNATGTSPGTATVSNLALVAGAIAAPPPPPPAPPPSTTPPPPPGTGGTQVVVVITDKTQTVWPVPTGISLLDKVEVWGAGGGGAGFNGFPNAGGGGAYTFQTNVAVVAGSNYAIKLGGGGAGGAGGGDGTVGADTWAGAITSILAKGGAAGIGASSTATLGGQASACLPPANAFSGGSSGTATQNPGGNGGGAAGPDGPGQNGQNSINGTPGSGGGGDAGFGGAGGLGSETGSGADGAPNVKGGGGGGGSESASIPTSGAGGYPGGGGGGNNLGTDARFGNDGQVRITYTIPFTAVESQSYGGKGGRGQIRVRYRLIASLSGVTSASPSGINILDQNLNIFSWDSTNSLAGQGTGIDLNGVFQTGIYATTLLAYQGLVYRMTGASAWSAWSDDASSTVTWTATSGDPRLFSPAVSNNGATILPAVGQLVDGFGRIWKITSVGQITRQGVTDLTVTNVLLLLYFKGSIYFQTSTRWARWTNNTWSIVLNDPRVVSPPAPSPPPPPAPPPPAPAPPPANLNLLQSCSTFNNTTYWTSGTDGVGTISVVGTTPDPNGVVDAQQIQFDTARSFYFTTSSAITLVAGQTYVATLRYKLISGTGTLYYGYFSGSAVTYAPVLTATSSWQTSPAFTFTVGAGDSAPSFIFLNNNVQGTTSVAATTIAVWGCLVAQGTTAPAFVGCGTAPPPPPPGSGVTLPSLVCGEWWWCFGGPTVAQVLAQAPHINFLSISNASGGGGTGTVSLGLISGDFTPSYSAAQLATDIAAWKATGRVAVLLIGGGGDSTVINNATNATQFVNSVIPIIDQLGVQGIDLDFENTPDATSVVSACKQLVTHYGVGKFLICMSPRPYELRSGGVYRAIISGLGAANVDLCQPQDYAILGDSLAAQRSYMDGDMSDFTTNVISANRIAIGCIDPGEGESTTTSVQTYNFYKGVYPTLRGATLWQTQADQSGGWPYATQMGAAINAPPPTPAPPPAPTESVNNTQIPPSSQIIDAIGNTWTMVATGGATGNQVAKNGVIDPNTNNVTLIAYENHVVWYETGTSWFSWNGSGWVAGADPRPVTPPPPPTPPPPAPTPPPPVSTAILPTPLLGMWITNSAGCPTLNTLLTTHPKYNHVAYYFLYGAGGDTSGTLTLDLTTYGGSSTNLINDIAAWKTSVDNKGNHRSVIVGCVDAFSGNGSAHYLTTTNATNAFNSIKSAINTYGFQGVEWDLEGGEGTTWNATTINSINAQLKAAFPNIMICGTPRPFECHAGLTKRGWMSSNDLTTMQYYFGADSGNGPWACSQIQLLEGGTDGNSEGLSQFVNGSDNGVIVPASKIVFGQYVTGSGQSGCTPAQYGAAFTNLATQYPGLRGAEIWQGSQEVSNGYTFESTFAPILGLTGTAPPPTPPPPPVTPPPPSGTRTYIFGYYDDGSASPPGGWTSLVGYSPEFKYNGSYQVHSPGGEFFPPNDGYPIVLDIDMSLSFGSDYAGIAAGSHDTQINATIHSFANDGGVVGNIYAVRIDSEFNGNLGPWIDPFPMPSGGPTTYKSAWNHVKALCQAIWPARVKYIFNPNINFATDTGGNRIDSYVPSGADIIGIDSYATTGGVNSAGLFGSTTQVGSIKWWQTIAVAKGLPLAFPEWGDGVGDGVYITDMGTFANNPANNVVLLGYWDSTVGSGGAVNLNGASARAAMTASFGFSKISSYGQTYWAPLIAVPGSTTPPPPPAPPPGGTNLLVAPTDFTNAAWREQGATTPSVTANSITNGGGWWQVIQNLTLVPGQQYTISGTLSGVGHAFGWADANGILTESPDNAVSMSFTPATSFAAVYITNASGSDPGTVTVSGLQLIAG